MAKNAENVGQIDGEVEQRGKHQERNREVSRARKHTKPIAIKRTTDNNIERGSAVNLIGVAMNVNFFRGDHHLPRGFAFHNVEELLRDAEGKFLEFPGTEMRTSKDRPPLNLLRAADMAL